MTGDADVMLGRAVFGTSRGLAAAGNGVLAGAGKCIGIFEFRGRAGPPRQLLDACLQRPAIFCRRAEDSAGGSRKVVLLGAIKACPDSQSRPGFFGACVAVPLDTRRSFHDWTSCGDEIRRLFEELAGQVDRDTGQLRFAGEEVVRPARRDEIVKWRPVQGEMLLLHNEGNGLSDVEKLPRLQAVAFAQGHRYPTVVAVETAVPDSRSLAGEVVTDAIKIWKTASDQADRERDLEGDQDQGELPGHERASSGNEPDEDRYRIARLEQAVESLQMSVVKLSRNSANRSKHRALEDYLWAGVVVAVCMSVTAMAMALIAML